MTFVQYWTRIRIFKDRSSLIFVSTSSKDVEKWHGFWGGRGSSTMGLLATIVVSWFFTVAMMGHFGPSLFGAFLGQFHFL